MLPSRTPRFFTPVLPQTLQNASLRLPPCFVEDHGSELGDLVHLHVRGGKPWKVELKRQLGVEVWLDRGLREFVEHHAIKAWYMLVFKYEGGSSFRVSIFDCSRSCEIRYSTIDAARPIGEGQSCPIVIGDEEVPNESLSGEEEETPAIQPRKPRSRFNEERNKISEHFKSEKPHFIINISRGYASGKTYVRIPAAHLKEYLTKCKDGDNTITVQESNGKTWQMQYTISLEKNEGMITSSGWKEFVQDNHFKSGDACIFELIDKKAKTYHLTVIRADDLA